MEIIRLIYKGRCKLTRDRVGHEYIQENTEKEFIFKKKVIPTSIGLVVECQFAYTSVKSPYKILYCIKNTDKIDAWFNIDKAVSDEQRMKKDINKDLKTKYDRTLATINEMVKELPPQQCRIFKLRLINDIL